MYLQTSTAGRTYQSNHCCSLDTYKHLTTKMAFATYRTLTISGTKSIKATRAVRGQVGPRGRTPGGTAPPPKPAVVRGTPVAVKAVKPAKSSGSSLQILSRVQELKLLSKVEKLGLLSKLEQSGLTLSKIEESGLLSFAEQSGVLTLVADTKTPGNLTVTGVALLGAAAALVALVGDDSALAIAGQAVGAVTFGLAGIGAIVGGSFLGKLQKL